MHSAPSTILGEALRATAQRPNPPAQALEALSFADELVETTAQDSRCALCGRDIAAGEAVGTFADLPRQTWGESYSMCHQSTYAPHICAECTMARRSLALTQVWAKALITPAGIYPMMRKTELAYYLLHPPETPFVMVQATAQREHVVWKAQVTTSQDLWWICIGGQNAAMYRPRVEQAWRANAEWLAKRREEAKALPTKKEQAAAMPTGNLWRANASTYSAGRVSAEAPPDIRKLLESLRPAERWYLSRIINQSPTDDLSAPEPY